MKKYILIIAATVFVSCNSNKKQPEKSMDTIKTNEVTVAYQVDAALGEGAIWNHETNELFWIDIEGKSLNMLNPKTKQNRSFSTASQIGTVVPKNKDEALIALVDGIYTMNLNTGQTTVFADMKEALTGCRLNDGKCDPAGRLWVGSMNWQQEKGKAKLFTIQNDAAVTTKIDSVTISNGIVWTKDKKTMYYIDTPTSQIKAYDYDNATGNISNERVAVEISTDLGFPDGMTIDAEDMVWVGMWNGNAVIRFNPKTGKLLRKIEVPAHNVTSCAFGGDNLETLFITSAKLDMTEEELKKYPLAGSVFKVNPGVKGVKSNFFK
ncbi:SMP-30/gluconolactonase/LRE family protein [uncultured Kordia sp.]|uniref:SMP-30/gluconolactonase/LRE family protein n=1 Tax=uncultured Kordia sp. TaxID=507699 RepID=UPI002615CF92|nr:SMP-30/gluconolactonase/LRE family protein [uncultured Kordia sp.]